MEGVALVAWIADGPVLRPDLPATCTGFSDLTGQRLSTVGEKLNVVSVFSDAPLDDTATMVVIKDETNGDGIPDAIEASAKLTLVSNMMASAGIPVAPEMDMLIQRIQAGLLTRSQIVDSLVAFLR